MQRIFLEITEKEIILGSSDAWSMSHLSQRPSEQVYYIEDCRILLAAPSLSQIFKASYRPDVKELSDLLMIPCECCLLLFFQWSFEDFVYY